MPRSVVLGKFKRRAVEWIRGTRPPLSFLAPRPSEAIIRAVQRLLPFYVRKAHRITGLEVAGPEVAARELARFYRGETRLIVAFRHPTTDDPPLLEKAFAFEVYDHAARSGTPLARRPHLYFVYDRAVLLGLSPLVTWLSPRFGNTPIVRAKADREGLACTRATIAEGAHPVAIAPEGGANDKSGQCAPVEDGLTQLIFWVQDEMARAGRPLPIVVLPTGIRYRHDPDPRHVNALLDEIDAALAEGGSPSGGVPADPRLAAIADPAVRAAAGRLVAAHSRTLDLLEDFYRRMMGKRIVPEEGGRAAALAHLALSTAEEKLAIKPGKSDFERLHKVTHVAHDRMFCDSSRTPVRDGLADLAAREAEGAMVHMRIAQALKQVDLEYLFAAPGIDRLVEMAKLLWDVIAYGAGIDPGQRMKVPKAAFVSFDAPIEVPPPAADGDWKARRRQFQETQQAIESALARLTSRDDR